jgi:tetratricopeptide (TPR) repeat protein
MSTSPDPLQTAVLHHQAGRLNDAAAIYQQILAANPQHADALHLLGVVAHQQGQRDQAVRLITHAIQIDGSRALYHFNLGEVCRELGRLPEAIASYRRAVELDPNAAPVWFGLAIAEHSAGDLVAAIEHCHKALSLQPNQAEALRLLATAHVGRGEVDEADACFEKLLAIAPDSVAALMQWGTLARDRRQSDRARDCFRRASALRPLDPQPLLGLGDVETEQKHWPEAIAAYQAAVSLNPNSALAHGQLGSALQGSGQLSAAVEHYRQAIGLAPNYVLAHYNLGTALDTLGQGDEAVECFHTALRIDPNYVDAYVNLGGHYQMLGDAPRALELYERALALQPDNAKAHFNRGLIWLGQGRFADGWAEYEWRVHIAGMPVAWFDLPRWTGQDIQNQTLLVHAEQGFGDTLQFARYLPLVQERCAKLVLLVHRPLIPFFKQMGYDAVFGDKHELPPIDCHVPMMSLPGIFQTDLTNIPAAGYLSIRQDLVDQWREKLAGIQGFKVGICWQGSRLLKFDNRRSFPLQAFAPLARIPEVRLISLQKTAGLEQLDELHGRFEVVDLRPGYDDEEGAFLNAAAIVKSLDLIVTADTAIAHLAGGLGVPVWVALPKHADWRWQHDRDDSPWYPTMKLFRQATAGDWSDVFARMADALRLRVERHELHGPTGSLALPPAETSTNAQALLEFAERLADEGRFVEAQRHLDRAVELQPQHAGLRRRAGDLQARLANWSEAIAHFERAIALDPADAITECHWAMALESQGNQVSAIDHYRQALTLAGQNVDMHVELGASLVAFGNLSQAWHHFEHALAVEPDNKIAYSTIASLGRQLDRCDEAIAHLDRTIEYAPEDGTARGERGTMLLWLGDFRRGWPDFHEWRARMGRPEFDWIQSPEWDGSPSSTTRLLVYAEWGLGDTIQFTRFLPLVRQRVPHAILMAQDPLVPLLRASGLTGVQGFADPVPEFDCKIAIMDLPMALDITLETLPADIPYLSVAEKPVAEWATRLQRIDGFRVGILWQGNPTGRFDRFRSFPLKALAPLARVPGVRLISLQKVAGLEQLDSLAGEFEVVDLRPEFDREEAAFFNAAAIIKNLDLVVTADSAIAHLSGALGAPVWIASSARSDWRWLRNREDSPWYPTMRVFHQSKRRQWDELFERMADELHREVSQRQA